MKLTENISLKHLTTFGVDARASFLLRAEAPEELLAALRSPLLSRLPVLPLGGGSNLLFVEDFEGVAIQLESNRIELTEEDAEAIYIRADAGVEWHALVERTIEWGYGGLENLSLIPGKVGAAPIQNIGAYGVELADVFHEVEVLDLATGAVQTMGREACVFGYRDSWFKHQSPGRYLILAVTVRLTKKPRWMLEYGGLAEALANRAAQPTAKVISEVVCEIRRNKLPDPAQIGNAGSFFKNPVVDQRLADALRKDYPAMPVFPAPQGKKLSAAWLIERCGWKGKRYGDAGVSADHALVLVNYGTATGAEIWVLAREIIAEVEQQFGVHLEPEPRIPGVNFNPVAPGNLTE